MLVVGDSGATNGAVLLMMCLTCGLAAQARVPGIVKMRQLPQRRRARTA